MADHQAQIGAKTQTVTQTQVRDSLQDSMLGLRGRLCWTQHEIQLQVKTQTETQSQTQL